MSDAYTGEIRMFAGTFAPQGWLMCDGSLQQISAYDVLFSLIGTTYGGDGQTTFGLPNLLGRVPVHYSSTVLIGQTSGTETVTLTTQQLPGHTHTYQGTSSNGSLAGPGNNVVASGTVIAFSAASATVAMNSAAVGSYGGSGGHPNIQPFQCLNFIICTNNVYPSQS